MFHVNPFCWRDEGFSTPFLNSGAFLSLGQLVIQRSVYTFLVLANLLLNSEIFFQQETSMISKLQIECWNKG